MMPTISRPRAWIIVCLLGLTLAGNFSALAADARPVLVATYRDNPPDMIAYCAESHSGPMRYVIEEAAERAGVQVKWKRLSLAMSLRALRQGEVDLIPDLFHKTAEREALGRFSESMRTRDHTVYFLIPKATEQDIRSIEQLSGFTIGYRAGSYFFPEFSDSKSLRSKAYDDDLKIVAAFVRGEINAVIVNNRVSIERAFRSIGFSEYKFATLTRTSTVNIYFLYSRDPAKQKYFDYFDAALLDMKRDGLIAEIYDSFGALPVPR